MLEALTSSAAGAVRLRETSPFMGILPEGERQAVLAAFAESRRHHARLLPPSTFERVLRSV